MFWIDASCYRPCCCLPLRLLHASPRKMFSQRKPLHRAVAWLALQLQPPLASFLHADTFQSRSGRLAPRVSPTSHHSTTSARTQLVPLSTTQPVPDPFPRHNLTHHATLKQCNVAPSTYHQRISPSAPKSKCQSRTHLTRSTPQLLKAKLSQHFNSSEHSTNFNSFQHFTKHEQERWKDRNLNTPKSVESYNTCAIDCLCVMKLCLCSWTSLARRYKYTKSGAHKPKLY